MNNIVEIKHCKSCKKQLYRYNQTGYCRNCKGNRCDICNKKISNRTGKKTHLCLRCYHKHKHDAEHAKSAPGVKHD